tara:strand:+ start:1862 stop:2692 length:831 start_codon:yes stop_codon:yes gene_type:complete
VIWLKEIFSSFGLNSSKRRRKFKKLGLEGYFSYLIQELGGDKEVVAEVELNPKMSRKEVDVVVADLRNFQPEPEPEPKPEWVKAAEEVTQQTLNTLAQLDEFKEEEEVVESEEKISVTMAEKPIKGGIIFLEDVKKDEDLVAHEDTEEIIEREEEIIQSQSEPEPEVEVIQESFIQPKANDIFVREETDYNSNTVRELQEICKEHGITIRGTKAEVVLRLKRHDEGLLGDTVDNEIDAPSQEAVDVELDTPSQEAVTEGEKNAANSEQREYNSEEE